MPVAAVIGAGKPVIRLGSSVVIRGISLGSVKNFFACVSGSEMTATSVTSDPVPAVVGMAKSGIVARLIFIMPSSLRSDPGFVAIAAMTLDASIYEPPTTARMALQPSRSSCAKPTST